MISLSLGAMHDIVHAGLPIVCKAYATPPDHHDQHKSLHESHLQARQRMPNSLSTIALPTGHQMGTNWQRRQRLPSATLVSREGYALRAAVTSWPSSCKCNVRERKCRVKFGMLEAQAIAQPSCEETVAGPTTPQLPLPVANLRS